MTIRGNYLYGGKASVQDADLVTLWELTRHLPWLLDLLEEIQWHRNERADGVCRSLDEDTEREDKITRLEALVAKLGITP